MRSNGPPFYANTDAVKQRILSLTTDEPHPATVVLDLAVTSELDVQTADTIGELVDALEQDGIALVLVDVRAPVLDVLRRARLTERVRIEPTLDEAVR